MTTTLLIIAALSILILVHEAGHFAVARWAGVRVERFSIGFGPVLLRWKLGETEYVLSLLPLGGYVKMAGEHPAERRGARWEYGSLPVWQRAGIVGAGPAVNYLMGLALFVAIFWLGYPTLIPRVGRLLEGLPAAAAGLQVGDQIVAVNGTLVDSWDQVTERVRRQTSGEPIAFAIRRADAETLVMVQPQIRAGHTLFGQPVRVAMVGMVPTGEVYLARYPWPQAVAKGLGRTWWLTSMTYQSLWHLLTGTLSVKESLTGPVGIFHLTASAAELGWRYVVQLFAILSVSLAIFNLLPIPVLDGGHLAFLGWEGLRRRPVSVRVQEVMSQAGMCLLLGMLVLVTYNDLMKFGLVQRVVEWFR